MTIYLDVIFAENIVMNYIILYASAIICKTKLKTWRIITSSAIGAMYAILAYIQVLSIYSNTLLKVFLSIVIVYLAFDSKTVKVLAKQLIVFYLTSFVFGGVSIALIYFIKPQDILMKNGIYIGTYPLKVVFLGAIVGFIVLKLTFKFVKGKLTRKELLCKITIEMEQKQAKAIAMIDTGNLLKEPITGANVIVIEKNSLKDLLPDYILDNVEQIIKGEILFDLGTYESRFRLIPFTSLGKQNGMLLGIKPDNIFIETEEEQFKVPNSIIGIYSYSFTKNGLYTAIIGVDLFERREQNEFTELVKK